MLGMVNLSGTLTCVGQDAKHWGWPYGWSISMQSFFEAFLSRQVSCN